MNSDPIELIRKIVKHLTAGTDYHALYRSKVISQSGDGTLEVKPDSSFVPPQSGVPIRTGIPGCTVKVKVGAYVLVGFEHSGNGMPPRAVATLWDADSIDSLEIKSTTIKLGASASESAILGDALVTWLTSHTHPTGVGPSGPPTSPPTGVKSGTVKVAS